MMGEITVGHLNVGGGDLPEVKTVPTGLLGCDFAIDSAATFLAHLRRRELESDLRAPLTQPGVNVQEVEYCSR